jgi:hypothetical protein
VGDEEIPSLLVGTEAPADLVAVDVREVDIEQDEIRPSRGDDEGLRAAGGLQDLVAGHAQHVADHVEGGRVIVDVEDGGLRGRPLTRMSRCVHKSSREEECVPSGTSGIPPRYFLLPNSGGPPGDC